MSKPYTVIEEIEEFIGKYVTFPDDQYTLPLALWVVGSYCWPGFDCFPYVVITSKTKRSGKTRLAELLSFMSSNPMNCGSMTEATIFRSISQSKPTIFFDEAETLSKEDASAIRAVLNIGYRKGQSVPRVVGKEVIEFETYCPKVFILIGDVYDTLRDRSIVVQMQRREARERFVYEQAKTRGKELREQISEMLNDKHMFEPIVTRYEAHLGLDFLTDRDEEIWLPLFAICETIAQHRVIDLQRAAVDIATEKTAPARKHINLLAEEDTALQQEYSVRLLRDMETILGEGKHVYSGEAIERLHAIPTAPWRKFRGEGLSANNMADMLNIFGVKPKLIRSGGRKGNVARGYKREDIEKAINEMTGGGNGK